MKALYLTSDELSEAPLPNAVDLCPPLERTWARDDRRGGDDRSLYVLLDPEIEHLCREWAEVAWAVLMRRGEHR